MVARLSAVLSAVVPPCLSSDVSIGGPAPVPPKGVGTGVPGTASGTGYRWVPLGYRVPLDHFGGSTNGLMSLCGVSTVT